MSKPNDTLKLDTLDGHSMLADNELDAVTGGMLYLNARIGGQCDPETHKCTMTTANSRPAWRGHDY